MVLAPLAKPPDTKLTKTMESLNVDAIGDTATFLLEAPCKDDDEAIRKHAKYVDAIREMDLADFEDADAAVVEAEDVVIVAEASNTYIDVDVISDNNNDLLEVLCKDNEAKFMLQAANLVEDLADFEGGGDPSFFRVELDIGC